MISNATYKVEQDERLPLASGEIRIMDVRWAEFLSELAKQNKKLVRANLAPISWSEVRQESAMLQVCSLQGVPMGPSFKREWTVVAIDAGEYIVRAGWEFCATVEHTDEGPVLHRVPGAPELPTVFYRATNRSCDHCHRQSARKTSYVLRNAATDDWTLVGSTCIREFLGLDPKHTIQVLSWFRGIGEYHEQRDWSRPSTDLILAFAASAVRKSGYARGETVAQVLHAYGHTFGQTECREKGCDGKWEPTEADVRTAQSAIMWMELELGSREARLNNYEHNLLVACRNAEIPDRSLGIVVSLIPTYLRIEERQACKAKEQEAKLPSHHVGEVGKRINLRARVSFLRDIDGDWGILTLIKLVTEDGAVLSWFASNPPQIAVGDLVGVTGTVKRHDTYKDERQTILVRCKLSAIEQAQD